MCGISGAITPANAQWPSELVARIVAYQHRRGPDASAIAQYPASDKLVTFGHNRLSIIDPVPGSNQPLSSADGEVVLVFNGEVYNYKELREELRALGRSFVTSSDSEVLLEAYRQWGLDGLDRVIGMFAFAIYDKKANRLILARDRFGVKPLYYYVKGNTLMFASTAGIIAQWEQLGPNLEYVARGIRLKYYEDSSDISPFAGVAALEPGHALICDLGEANLSPRKYCYYDLAERVRARVEAIAGRGDEDLIEEFGATLNDACRLRLRSDVPVGLSLSGGLDSSSIAAITGRMQPGLVAFSFGNPDDTRTEAPLAAQMAASAGVDMRFIWPSAGPELSELFRKTLRAQGAPFPHTSQMAQYAVFERAKADGVTVLLGGQGGDEALMGYRKFFLFRLQEILRARRVADLPEFAVSAAFLLPSIMARANVFWSERSRYQEGGQGMGTGLRLPVAEGGSPVMTQAQTLRDRQVEDLTRFSIPTLLRYEDRNSMGNSIESRLPFMDHRLVELGVAMPVRTKLARGYGKFALRKAMKGLVPDSIRLSRDKRGFDTQQAEWIRSGLGNTLRDMLHEAAVPVREFMAPGTSVATSYSDDALIANPQALKEAISLIWMADPVRWQQDLPAASAPPERQRA